MNSSSAGHKLAFLRITFGIIWLIDAILKWTPSFRSGFLTMIQGASQGQPTWLNPWFHFWYHLLSRNPNGFVTLVAVLETLVAVSLIFGLARRINYLFGPIFSVLIWGVGEGFGGPYVAGSTDIGTGIIYALVFIVLFQLEQHVLKDSLAFDTVVSKHVTWWSHVASTKQLRSAKQRTIPST